MLSNFDLIKMAKKRGLDLVGVFMKDELNFPIQSGAYIINMSNDKDEFGNDNNGTHWVSLYVDSSLNSAYFDSFGFPMPKEILKFIKPSKIKCFSQKELQNIKSEVCGLYALYFCLFMSKHCDGSNLVKTFNSLLNQFSENPRKNETILKNQIKKM